MSRYRAKVSPQVGWISGALVSLAAGFTTAAISSYHLAWPVIIGTFFATLITLSFILKYLDSKADRHRPSSAQQAAAQARLELAITFLSDRLGIDDDYLNPELRVFRSIELSQELSSNQPIPKGPVIDSLTFIAQVVDNPRCTVILGAAGSGKTTMLLRLARRLIDERINTDSGLIPLFLELRDWSDQYSSLSSWVINRAADLYGTPQRVSDYWIRSGQLLLALDGMDEVHRDLRSGLLKAIGTWAESAEGTRVVLTARSSIQDRRDLTQWLKADQIGLLQSLSVSDVDVHLRRLLTRLGDSTGLSSLYGMRDLLENVISADEVTEGPVLLGLLAECVREVKEGEPKSQDQSIDNRDSARAAFDLGNEFLRRGDFLAARDAYQVTVRFTDSRWSAAASILKGTCLFALGDREGAREAMIESVAMRLQQSLRLGGEFKQDVQLSNEEREILSAMSEGISYDLIQVSSSAKLSTNRSRPALQSLREKGLVETADSSGGIARFRLSPITPVKS
jgi:NACHT domain